MSEEKERAHDLGTKRREEHRREQKRREEKRRKTKNISIRYDKRGKTKMQSRREEEKKLREEGSR